MNSGISSEMITDDKNPNFLFNCTDTDLLIAIVSGRIDARKLAKMQLESRGLNSEGEWVGFKKVASGKK